MIEFNKFIIQNQVATFRATNDLGPSEPVNLKSLLLRLNVLTLFRPLSDSFSGMCLKDGMNHRFMLINCNHPVGRQHFTIAHELYHLFIEENFKPHKCTPGETSKDPIERSADMFASLFLMPESGILRMIPKEEIEIQKISIATILKLERYFSVSRAALLIRLLNIGLITDAQRNKLKETPVKVSARQFGYDTALYEPANCGLVIGDFGEKARTLFEQGKISEGHYLELMQKIIANEQED